MPSDEADRLLVARIRRGETDAWSECIARFEGRLLAFVDSRLNDRAASEDVVQETFLGFLIGLPNFDDATPLESFLFSIAAHKLTDVLRRQGRRPTLPLLLGPSSSAGDPGPVDMQRASGLAQSRERRSAEEHLLRAGLQSLIDTWRTRGDFERLKCIELLFVLGWTNQAVAQRLMISEQAVANHKSYTLGKLREWIQKSPLPQMDLTVLGMR